MNLCRLVNRKITTFCKRHFIICIILVVIFLIIYIERLSFMLNTNTWFQFNCTNSSQCLKILLIADPQITGHEHFETLNFLAQYDGDSYLKKTYEHAFNFIEPNLTIFLGDLIDEGSTATDEEYEKYLERFFYIFPKNNKQIWLPGDNDIGGEGRDRITTKKIKRFNEHFQQENIFKMERFKFVLVNQMAHVFPKSTSKRNFYNTTEIYVVLSHLPLLFMPSVFVEKVLSVIQPQVVFSAHQHKSMILSSDGTLRQDRQIIPLNPGNGPHTFTLGLDNLYEIMVPTCSYRMGTMKIGFGYAVLEKDVLQYTVLWSPSRFHQLFNYIFIVLVVFIIFIFSKFYQ